MTETAFLDALAALGESALSGRDTGPAAEHFRAILGDAPESASALSENMDRFVEAVEEALAYLGGPATLRLDPDTADGVHSALGTLDQVVFLAEALDALPEDRPIDADMGERIDRLLTDITIDRPPPFPRLTPLNDWRREKRDALPEKARYLFPWYDSWTDLPADFLHRLTLQWDTAMKTRGEALSVPPHRFDMMLAELNEDKPLMATLHREAMLHGMLREIVRETPAIRLHALYLKILAERPPASLAERIGISVLLAREAHTGPDAETALSHALLTGFFLPGLDARERMDRFSEAAALLPSVSSDSPIAEALSQWLAEQRSDDAFVDQLNTLWETELYRAAARMDESASVPEVQQNRLPVRRSPRPTPRLGMSHRLKIAFKWALGVAGASSLTAAAMLLIMHRTIPELAGPPVSHPTARVSAPPAPDTPTAASNGEAEAIAQAEDQSPTSVDIDAHPIVISLFQPIATGEEGPSPSMQGDLGKLKIVSRLEEMDLSDIRLVGIVVTASGRKALVEDGENHGFILKPGTPVGNRSGRVTDIRNDRVIIEETETDASGNTTPVRRIIRFPDAAYWP